MAFLTNLATLVVDIVVNTQRYTTNMQRVNNGLNQTKQQVQQLQLSFAKVRTAAAGLYLVKNVFNSVEASIYSVVSSAADLERGFLEIAKAAEIPYEGVEGISNSFGELAKRLRFVPIKDLQAIGVTAAQMGLSGKALLQFTESVGKFSAVSENLKGEAAANFFGLLIDVFDLNVEKADNLSNVLSSLALSLRTNEGEIARVTSKLATNAKVFGLNVAQTLSLSAALKTLGPTSEVAASTLNRLFIELKTRGGEIGGAFGLDPVAFQKLIDTQPLEGLKTFLTTIRQFGQTAPKALLEVKLNSVRLLPNILALADGFDDVWKTVQLGEQAFTNTDALIDRLNTELKSLNTTLTDLKNAWESFKASIGNNAVIKAALDQLTLLIRNLERLTNSSTYKKIFTSNGYTDADIEKISQEQFVDVGNGRYISGKILARQIKEIVAKNAVGATQLTPRPDNEKPFVAQPSLKAGVEATRSLERLRIADIGNELHRKLAQITADFEEVRKQFILAGKSIEELAVLEARAKARARFDAAKDREDTRRRSIEEENRKRASAASEELNRREGLVDFLATDKQKQILELEKIFKSLTPDEQQKFGGFFKDAFKAIADGVGQLQLKINSGAASVNREIQERIFNKQDEKEKVKIDILRKLLEVEAKFLPIIANNIGNQVAKVG